VLERKQKDDEPKKRITTYDLGNYFLLALGTQNVARLNWIM
jgi:hypothetical protein